MGYPVQNSETGELDYVHADLSRISPQAYDEETGEPASDQLRVRYVKNKSFQIPKKYLRGTPCDEFEKEIINDYEALVPHAGPVDTQAQATDAEIKQQKYSRDAYMNMEGVHSDIILAYSKNNHHLFLVPTFFFCNIYILSVIFLLEYLLHLWAHKKNDFNMNKSVYYRSPMHVLTSHFCATCRTEEETKVLNMFNRQLRLARKSQTLKNVTKVMG